MSATLYLLRQPANHLSPSLFRVSDKDMDVVFMEHPASIILSSMRGAIQTDGEPVAADSQQVLTYDDLVEKIFEADHIIVL
ncbi:MAG: hypothetical protein HOP22_06415 [Nitrospiraceae bacterium]|jgi:hypothetical protein|nr:hypothetical protein [Nitrospiraceae bacterium]